MRTTVVDKTTGKEYEVDENGNILDPNRRRYGPADPRVDPRTTSSTSLSQLAKDKEEAETKALTKDYAPQGYDPGFSNTPTNTTPTSTTNTPTTTTGTGVNSGLTSTDVMGAGLGGYGLWDMYQNKQNLGTRQGYMQGATSGAAVGSAVGGPYGALVGAGIGASLGSGNRWVTGTEGMIAGAQTGARAGSFVPVIGTTIGGVLGAIGGAWGGYVMGKGESRTKYEENKRKKLAEMGIIVPEHTEAPHGKPWELNQAFAESRNEGDLIGSDLVDAADFYAAIPDWGTLSKEDQAAVAQSAIDNQAVREHHGGIDIDFENPGFRAFAEQMLMAYKDPKRTMSYAEAYPMEYAAALQAQKQEAAARAMSLLGSSASEYNNPFSGETISLSNPYL